MQSCTPFYVVALSQLIYLLMQSRTAYYTAREGFLAALLLAVSYLPFLWMLCKIDTCPRWKIAEPIAGKVLAVLLFCWCWVQIFQISDICRREYQTGGVWILLLAIGLLALRADWHALSRMTQTIWAIAVVAVVLLVGVVHHVSWQNLSFDPINSGRTAQAYWALFYFCPEFLALPWMGNTGKKFWWKLPAVVFFLQGVSVLAAEAVFGWEAETGRFPSLEAVRCCGIGAFSRLDDIFVGLWLFLSLYRIAVLWQLIKIVSKGGRNIALQKE